MSDELKPTNEWRAWVVCLIPRWLCRWVWGLDVALGYWAPHIFGRMIGASAWNRRSAEEPSDEY